MKKSSKNTDKIKTNGEKCSSKCFKLVDLLYSDYVLEIIGNLFLLILILVAYFTGKFSR